MEADAYLLKQVGGNSHSNVICPKYIFKKRLNTYVEVDKPPNSMYKAVGYNNLERVNQMLHGTDEEKRNEDFQSDFSHLT